MEAAHNLGFDPGWVLRYPPRVFHRVARNPGRVDSPVHPRRLGRGATLLSLTLTALLSCSAAGQASKVLSGARTALEGLCEHVPSPHLEMALQLLDRQDLPGAVHYLRAELVEHPGQRDVAALLTLIESQMPEAVGAEAR